MSAEPAPPSPQNAGAWVGLPIGLVAGFFGGLMGVGGGIVMIPLLVSVCRLRQRDAHGTSLVALVFTGLTGASTYATRGSVDLMAALFLAVPAMITARYGTRFSHALPEWKLKHYFGAFLIFMGLLLVLKPYLPQLAHPLEGLVKLAVLTTAGGITGFLSGAMGVGGGALMVPAMVLLAGFGQYLAQGTSLLAMIPTAVVGAHAHWQLGSVAQRLLLGLIPGILLGTYAGGSVALELPQGVLRLLFTCVVVWIGLRNLRVPRPS